MQTDNISNRIKQVIALKYQNNRRIFCMRTGIAPGTLGPIINGHRFPGHGFYEKLLECHPELSVTWIITGNGEMILPDINVYRLEIEQLKIIIEFLKNN